MTKILNSILSPITKTYTRSSVWGKLLVFIVLFLFVVMMLNIKGSKKKNKFFYNILFYILTFSLLFIIFLYNIVNINNFIFFKSFIEKIKELLFLSF